MPALISNTL